MTAELPPRPAHWQQWPCGPECRHAQPMPGTFGEWHWCSHPQTGGQAAHHGLECISYEAATSLPDQTAAARWKR